MDKAYNPKQNEDAIYKRWEASGFFDPDNLDGEPFSLMMPPPNVTGVLHLGHALENTLMDVMIRYQRMQGKKTLLLPGTDHAAIATQSKVEKMLMAQGIENPRQELGREMLLKKIKEFSEQSKATILNQIKKMGTSADWSRLAYTFDEDRNKAVNTLFIRMYNDGLIYRGYRVVNWSVKGQSTCSDDEIVTIERPAVLYTFKYAKNFPVAISTTRPETKVGDTAVAVHPEDERYRKYIGKTYTVDFAETKLSIKIIASEEVDPEFGTGALGVTPAHSAIDFGMYELQKAKQDPIEIQQVIGADGKMNAEAGMLAGKTVEEARDAVVGWLSQEGLLESSEEIVQNVGTSDRYGDVIEAIPMTQWWLDVNKEIPGRGKTLRDLMREAVTTGLNGDASKIVTITPDRFAKPYMDRIDNLRDWCLSRQLWWGHRIPAWYKDGEIFVGTNVPDGPDWVQDEDTLDTWFSSGSWTFSTLGWPEKTKDLETFHPTSWMQMGYEILYLWLMRMILMSTYALGEVPFRDVYIHGILRDKDGKKFSKSAGNGIDPIDIIEKYGTDALRFSLIAGVAPGNDARFYEEKVEGAKHLVNKLWNISRYIVDKGPGTGDQGPVAGKTLADAWILSRLDRTIEDVTSLLDSYQFSQAAETLRAFTWDDVADWYLEITKIEEEKSDILSYILQTLLKLWHPFLPFVTEQIWSEMFGKEHLIMVERWPKVAPLYEGGVGGGFTLIQSIITAIRSLRAEKNIPPAAKLAAYIKPNDHDALLKENEHLLLGLARLERIEYTDAIPETSVGFVEGGVEVFLDLSGAVDTEKETVRLEKEIAEVAPYVASLEKKLKNKEFVNNAPEAVVEKEREKLKEAKEKLTKLREQLASF